MRYVECDYEGKIMNETRMREIARGSVEQHLGDVAAEYPDEELTGDSLYDEAYTLAFDALGTQEWSTAPPGEWPRKWLSASPSRRRTATGPTERYTPGPGAAASGLFS
jgi:hypothetical protein